MLLERLSTFPGGTYWLSVKPFYYSIFACNNLWWEGGPWKFLLRQENQLGIKKTLPMEKTRKNVLLSFTKLPPKAVPFHVRPVTSWNGRVATSCPAAATPTTTLTPQPLWQASRAALCGQKGPATQVSVFTPGHEAYRRRCSRLLSYWGWCVSNGKAHALCNCNILLFHLRKHTQRFRI